MVLVLHRNSALLLRSGMDESRGMPFSLIFIPLFKDARVCFLTISLSARISASMVSARRCLHTWPASPGKRITSACAGSEVTTRVGLHFPVTVPATYDSISRPEPIHKCDSHRGEDHDPFARSHA